jgi:hypothetical protein
MEELIPFRNCSFTVYITLTQIRKHFAGYHFIIYIYCIEKIKHLKLKLTKLCRCETLLTLSYLVQAQNYVTADILYWHPRGLQSWWLSERNAWKLHGCMVAWLHGNWGCALHNHQNWYDINFLTMRYNLYVFELKS